ncbi:MAG: sulfotransferase family protein [Anaerolineae bacterium]|nr:sulfotransferase family protein [Anaerolineae bacterium]
MFGKRQSPVIIVSGLPRSGTSMMMRMLEKGGLSLLADGIRRPNDDNPKGYYEFERVKKLPEGDVAWLADAQDKGVKIIAALLVHLPNAYTYKILFMRRKMDEILASQRRMLERRGEDSGAIDDAEMARLFEAHVAQIHRWMDQQPYLTYLDVDYNEVLADPVLCLAQVDDFLALSLDLKAMAAVVDPTLYRQRA